MSEIKVNKVSPATGTAITLGDSGDTFTVPSGATIVNSGTASGFGGGKVLQVVSTTKTDAFTSTSGTFVDVTGLTASITPSATSSKVLVLVSISGGCTSERLKIGLIENSTLISAGVASGSRPGVTGDIRGAASTQHSWSINHLAEPATTSSTTYKIQVYTTSGTIGICREGTDANNTSTGRTASSITLLEIGA